MNAHLKAPLSAPQRPGTATGKKALRPSIGFFLALLVLLGFVALFGSCKGSWLSVAGVVAPVPGNPVHLSGSPEQSDLPLQFAVWWEEVRRLVKAGEPPWISDRIGGGVPLFANGQTGVPWPLQLPVWLWGPEVGTSVMAVLKVLAAFFGMWVWLSRLGCGLPARWFGALSFSLSLNFFSWLPVPLTWVVAATPWAFWLLARTLRGQGKAGAALAVLLGTLLGWSTHPETAAFLALALALAGFVLGWGRFRRLRRLLPPLAIAGLIGLGFGLPVILTVLDSAKFHAVLSPAEGLSWHDKLGLASLLWVPFRLGHPADWNFAFPFPHAPVALACGSVAWLLLLAGETRTRHRRWVLALGSVALFAVGLFFELPGFREVGRALPVLRHMTWPRVAFLLPFCLIAMAALRFPKRPIPAWRLALAWLVVQGVVLVLTLASIPGTGPRVWPTVAVPTLAAGLLALRRGVLLPLLAALEAGFWSFSVLPVSRLAPENPVASLLARWVQPGERVLAVGHVVPANLLARMGFSDLRSHDPVRPRSLAALHAALGARGEDLPGPITTPWAGLAGAWGVRWLLSGPEGLTSPWDQGWEEVDRNGHLRLYRNRRFLPVLRLATRALPPPGEASQGQWEGVDFARTAVVSSPPVLSGEGELEIVEKRPWRVRVRVETSGPVLAVFHAPRAPGWQAFLDGHPVPLVTANLGAMGVVVPQGTHEVMWRYGPPGLGVGLALGFLGFAAAGVYALRGRRHAVC